MSATGISRTVRRTAVLVAALSLLLSASAWAAPQRVAVLPFTANAKEDISYLVKGVRDMLASRLAWQDKVVVIEPDLVAPVMKEVPPPYNEAKARKLGSKLSADVVVYGSITALGSTVSVDAQVVRVKGKQPPLSTFVQAADLNQVIPQINDFAKRINAEIFRRPEAVAAMQKQKRQEENSAPQAAASGKPLVEAPKTPAAEWQQKRAVEVGKLPPNISPLNPLFLRSLSGVDSDRYWRSPRIDGVVESLAVGDIDNDGLNEMVVLLPKRIRVYRLDGQRFGLINEFRKGPDGEYLFVDIADLDGNGRPEIFVSNIINGEIVSFVLEWGKGGLAIKAKGIPWFFRAQPNPTGKGMIVWGQGKSISSAFAGPVYRMKYENGQYLPDKPIQLPQYANVFNFVRADLNGSGHPMTVMVAPGFRLKVFGKPDDELFASGEMYAGSSKFIEVPSHSNNDPSNPGDEPAREFLPTRLIINDLDKDGRAEIVVVRNKDSLQGIMENMQFFYQGTIYSLYWNGMSLMENWRTPRISGYLTDYTIADVGNVGRPALVLSVVQTKYGGMVEKGFSHIVAFTLKPQAKKKKHIIKRTKGL